MYYNEIVWFLMLYFSAFVAV